MNKKNNIRDKSNLCSPLGVRGHVNYVTLRQNYVTHW